MFPYPEDAGFTADPIWHRRGTHEESVWLGCVAAALTVMACGGGGGSDDGVSADTPEGAVQAYVTSLREKDFAAACGAFTGSGIDEQGLEGTGVLDAETCEKNLGVQYADAEVLAYEDVALETIEETDTTAVVEMTEASSEGTDSVTTISLVKEGDEWKIEGSSYEQGTV